MDLSSFTGSDAVGKLGQLPVASGGQAICSSGGKAASRGGRAVGKSVLGKLEELLEDWGSAKAFLASGDWNRSTNGQAMGRPSIGDLG